ncbi:hypothetical protein B484DRAFT_427299 [Ochromonadaceae sp. CCMP2298]|nr:hypothetical protein B484DRAFT_427299 [Ochromonadaceae sp. CCMP2298]
MGALLNHTAAVVCTDRHTSFAPALRASLPLAHHRHDLRHIMQNMNALGYISRYMWEAQKATTYGECLLCMKSWIAEQPQIEEYLHPSNLHPRMWTYYTAVLDPNPHCLYGLTGSQHVEGEMHRLKVCGVRHELPLKAIINFITLYVGVVDGCKKEAQKMVAKKAVLTDYASLTCRTYLNKAAQYDIRHTLPPCEAGCGDRSQLALKRKKDLVERNFAPLPKKYNKRADLKKTKKNVEENCLERALEVEGPKRDRSLRQRANEFANMLFGTFTVDEGMGYPMPQHDDDED